MSDTPAYGLWSLVVINSLFFIAFAFGFTRPRSKRDWRSFDAMTSDRPYRKGLPSMSPRPRSCARAAGSSTPWPPVSSWTRSRNWGAWSR